MSYKAGDIIDEYKLLSECGSGAYGTVFLAENQITTRRLALKIVYKNNCTSERELKGLQQYQIISENTNLLQIYRVKEYDDFFYYTMDAADNLITPDEYIPDTLGNRLKNGPLPEKNQKTLRKTNAQAPVRPAAQPEPAPESVKTKPNTICRSGWHWSTRRMNKAPVRRDGGKQTLEPVRPV